ncbi:MAG: 16S rRNA (guanine(966)-N(2))-methyltransferase RsmD [Candidatus Margulisiibacteriota bacterium]
MRIISGKAKGRKLKSPKPGTRPLTDRAREALFNILAPRMTDSDFLDVFAGTGAVGIEALSRGARLAIFIEIDRQNVEIIRQNLEHTGFLDAAEVFHLEALRGLKILEKKGAKFDIIFLGAPYGSRALGPCLEFIGSAGLLNPQGVMIAEHRIKSELGGTFGALDRVREERYGDTQLAFYENSHLSR